MRNNNLKKYSAVLSAGILILTAAVLRQIGFRVDDPLGWLCNFFRSLLYVGLFAVWGVSFRRRIIHPQVRRYLTVISVLMVFWIAVRTIRFLFVKDSWLLRHLWYLYYLPMLFIPLLAVFVALSLGRKENYRLSGWMRLLYIPAVLLLLLVLTNDLHQFVFDFPMYATVWGNDYRHAAGYFFAVVWMVLCALAALVIMIVKCRTISGFRGVLPPFVPVMLALLYGILYIMRMPLLRSFVGDMTVVFCLLFAAVLECCIQCGLIQSNTGYEELFMVSRLGAQITDQNHKVYLASFNARELTEAERISAGKQPVWVDKGTLVKSQPIRFGYVLWQADISTLAEAIEQSEENCRNLAERNTIQQKNLETQKNILALQEKSRVNDFLNRETARQIDLIDRMLAEYEMEPDDGKRRRLLAGAAVAGAFIKRYGNLLLISKHAETGDILELARCFEESFVNLELLGVNCLHTLPADIFVATKDMLRVYHGFEMAVEACMYDLQCVWINAREREDGMCLNVEFVCDTDISLLASVADVFSCEDEAYRFTYIVQKRR